MMHFNKIKTGMWASMIFTPQFHSIYCLYLCLKHEGMNYIADKFKIPRIIWDTYMITTKTNDILVCPKKCLSKCRDRLRLTYEGLQGPTLQIVSQVQTLMTNFRQKKFSIEMYRGGIPYISPVEAWMNKTCQSNPSPWHQYKDFQAPTVI